MNIRGKNHFLILGLTFSLMLSAPVAVAQVGVNIYGVSYHYRPPENRDFEAFNPGLGLHWTFDRSAGTSWESNLGLYWDSSHTASYHLSFGGRVRIRDPLELGLHMTWVQDSTTRWGRAPLYPYPFLAYRCGDRAAVTFLYIPHLGDAWPTTLGAYVTVFPFAGGWNGSPDDRLDNHPNRSAFEFRLRDGLTLASTPGLGITWRRYFTPRNALRLGAVRSWLRSIPAARGPPPHPRSSRTAS